MSEYPPSLFVARWSIPRAPPTAPAARIAAVSIAPGWTPPPPAQPISSYLSLPTKGIGRGRWAGDVEREPAGTGSSVRLQHRPGYGRGIYCGGEVEESVSTQQSGGRAAL